MDEPKSTGPEFREIPESVVFPQRSKEKLAQMYLPIRTMIRLIGDLGDCKTRFAPAWGNAIGISVGLFLPSLICALVDLSNENPGTFSISIWMIAAVVFLVATVLCCFGYFTCARVENASIDRVIKEMKDILESWKSSD